MGSTEDEVYCSGCTELLFRVIRQDDGTTLMKSADPKPEEDGSQLYFRCPTCRSKNLVRLVQVPLGSHYYEIFGFVRS